MAASPEYWERLSGNGRTEVELPAPGDASEGTGEEGVVDDRQGYLV